MLNIEILDKANLPSDPSVLIAQFMDLANQKEWGIEYNAFALATSDPDLNVSLRYVVCPRFCTEKGFCFYTNGNSRKAQDLL